MALLPCRSCCSARHGSDLWQGPVTPQDRHAARDRSTALESPNWDGETQPYLPVNKNISLLLPSITQHKPAWSRFSPEHSSITQHGSAEPNTAQFQPSLFPACTARHGPVQPISRAVQPISSPAHFQPLSSPASGLGCTELDHNPAPPIALQQELPSPSASTGSPGGSSTVPDPWLQPQEAAQKIPAMPGTTTGGPQEGWRG